MFEHGIDYVFNDVSLYATETFKVFNLENDQYTYDKDEFFRFLYYIGIAQEKLITNCHICKKEFPFTVDKELFCFYDYGTRDVDRMVITENIKINNSFGNLGEIQLEDGMIIGLQPPYNKETLLNNKIWYINYFFKCANSNSHKYMMMISIELKNGAFKVRKIGQNPSMLTVKGFDFEKYRKFLDEINAYDDYKKAELSNSEHFYVGAYAYLRRIFEKMLNYYLGNTKLEDEHIDTKIKAVKEHFDPRIKNLLKNLYSILSVSIHELDEEQSKDYYESLKAVIDMQLEYIKTEADKDNQSKKLDTVLSKIVNLVKKERDC